ncbi:cupin domain-containing protein [Nocardioides sp. LHD-245]|uniref:cupin domain-containing protein n=1 Tax=Nocardioides sp. LHD-245 TaxID=3051387 RepID=UPI0027DF6EC4|nr:cupin domain-containing protein [Nocardioides sp. LHD-245]
MNLRLNDSLLDTIDLRTTPLHLGLGCRSRPVEGFAFEPAALEAYADAVADDGREGRLVVLIDEQGRGSHWERHPGGEEVIVCVSGAITVVREIDGEVQEVTLQAGEATVNPAGVWHAVDTAGEARILTITPGPGTEHRAR